MKAYLAGLLFAAAFADPAGAAARARTHHLSAVHRERCVFLGYELVVDDGRLGPDATDFQELTTRETKAFHTRSQSTDRDLLILSGGSLHGAFTAGFYAGILAANIKVPNYNYVTAVSTGSLSSTLIFLANRKETDRHYPAYMHASDDIENVEALASLFSLDKEGEVLKSRKFPPSWLTHGLETFSPLRSLLTQIMSPQTLADISSEASRDRHLFVGVANLADGNGYAIDLTEFVKRSLHHLPDETISRCYIDVLLASSAVPPGIQAIPLTVMTPRSRPMTSLYIDGGARFGVFWENLRKLFPKVETADMIVNGTLSIGNDDHFQGSSLPNIVRTGFRAIDVMENQDYKFSVAMIKAEFSNEHLRFAYVSKENLSNFSGDISKDPDDFRMDTGVFVGKTCGWLRDTYDKDKYHPIQFYPNYMQCLVRYGEARGKQQAWNYEH